MTQYGPLVIPANFEVNQIVYPPQLGTIATRKGGWNPAKWTG
jgi:hypothetical protein